MAKPDDSAGKTLDEAARAVRKVLHGAADAYDDAAAAHDELARARDDVAALLDERQEPDDAADRRQKSRRASNDATSDRIKADHRGYADQTAPPDD